MSAIEKNSHCLLLADSTLSASIPAAVLRHEFKNLTPINSKEPIMETREHPHREVWNKGKLVGQKPPVKPKDIWAIRIRLQIYARSTRPRYVQHGDRQQAPRLRPRRPARAQRDAREPSALPRNGNTAKNAEVSAVRTDRAYTHGRGCLDCE